VRGQPGGGLLGQDHPPPAERGGDRQANNALWRITLTRLRVDPAPRVDAQRRTTQGKTTKDFPALPQALHRREPFPLLKAGLQHANGLALT
jgi:transposase